MIITKHGETDPLYKGVVHRGSMTLIFFGWSAEHVQRKAAEWLLIHEPVRPSLKLVQESQA